MIGTVDIEIQAANPQMPLPPIRAYKNSPTSVRLRNVPKAIGNWKITSVQIVAIYPDNSIRVGNCVLVGGVWVGTIEGSKKSGRSENGFTVFASGTDEHDNSVNNYVLGKGLIEIMNEDGSIDPEDTSSFYVRLYDNPPSEMYDGFMYPSTSGYVIWQNGEGHAIDAGAKAFAQEAYDLASSVQASASEINVVATSALTLASSAYSLASSGYDLASSAYGLASEIGGQLTLTNASVSSNATRLDTIEGLVPSQASTSNQLADKDWVTTNATTLASSAYTLASNAGQVAANATTLAQNAGTVASQALSLASAANTSVASLGQSLASIGQIVTSNTSRIGNVEALVPEQASEQNQLADKSFVNSSVQTATANFRGNWATWANVPTDVNDYPVDYAGSKVPTVNDYLVVQDASGFVGSQTLEGTWRFKYSGVWGTDGKNGWLPEYQVNETPMTAAQLAAINSNITASKVAFYDSSLSGLEQLIDSI